MPGMGRVGRLAVGIVGVLVIIAAGIFALRPDKPVKDAGQVLGLTTAPSYTYNALIIGDSYTEGTGANSKDTGYAAQVVKHFGWSAFVDGQGGTGFTNPGPQTAGLNRRAIPQRVAALDPTQFSPTSTIIVDAGLNDTSGKYAGPNGDLERQAVTSTFAALRKDFPRAKIVAFGPWDVGVVPTSHEVDDIIAAAAKTIGASYFSPIDEDWTPGDHQSKYIGKDGTHPNQAGHDHIAQLMEADLAKADVGTAA